MLLCRVTISLDFSLTNNIYTMKYKWIAFCHDWAFEDDSRDKDGKVKTFDSIKECYNDMRNAVLEKMKWNTNYDEDFEHTDDTLADAYFCDAISYKVWFEKRTIVHKSFSGTYVYLIVADDCNPTYYDVFNEGMVNYLKTIEMLDFGAEETIKSYHRRHEELMRNDK